MPAEKLTQYSFSRLDLYEKCPWAYKKVHLDGIPRVSNEAMVTGKTVHALIADYLLRLINQKQQTDWEWAEGAAPKDASPDVLQIWEKFYNSFVLPPALEVYGVEHKLAFDRNWHPCEFSADEAYFRVVFYELDPQEVTTILLNAGLSREEVWPLLSMTKTNLEKGLRKLKRRDLLEQALSTAAAKGSEKIDFRKANS